MSKVLELAATFDATKVEASHGGGRFWPANGDAAVAITDLEIDPEGVDFEYEGKRITCPTVCLSYMLLDGENKGKEFKGAEIRLQDPNEQGIPDWQKEGRLKDQARLKGWLSVILEEDIYNFGEALQRAFALWYPGGPGSSRVDPGISARANFYKSSKPNKKGYYGMWDSLIERISAA